MEIQVILLFILAGIILSIAFHFIQRKMQFKKHPGDLIFIPFLAISLLFFIISYAVGAWTGLFFGALGIYIFTTSLSGLIITQLLKKYKK